MVLLIVNFRELDFLAVSRQWMDGIVLLSLLLPNLARLRRITKAEWKDRRSIEILGITVAVAMN